jgi:hypothetical protein
MNTFTLRAGSKDRDCSGSEQLRLSMRDQFGGLFQIQVCDRNEARLWPTQL